MKLRAFTVNVSLTALLTLLICDSSGAADAAEAPLSAQAPIGVVSDRPNDQGLEGLERGARQIPLTGDLDAILERGYIRVLAPYSKT